MINLPYFSKKMALLDFITDTVTESVERKPPMWNVRSLIPSQVNRLIYKHWYLLLPTLTVSITGVVVCTDLWGKELHRQIGVGIVVTSGRNWMLAHRPGMPDMRVWFLLYAQYFIIIFSSHPWHWVLWPWSYTRYMFYGCWTCPVYVYIRPLPLCMQL